MLRWLIIGLWFLGRGAAHALEVVESRWGFAGTILPNLFNPLTLLVRNDLPVVYDGSISVGQDETLVQELYLTPGQVRMVQFHVWCPGALQVKVRWNGGEKTLDEPKEGRDAVSVRLTTGEVKEGSSVNRWREFPAEWFPASRAALDGLSSVELDAVPRWETPRRMALLDWIHAGGELRIGPQVDGKLPFFEGELAVLNQVEGMRAFGLGRVVVEANGATAPGGIRYVVEDEKKFLPSYYHPPTIAHGWLAEMVRPVVNWTLISWLGVVYFLIVVPGLWWFSRKSSRVLNSLLIFFGSTALFSSLLAWVGRRGHGEHTQIQSLAVARPVSAGNWDVTQYANLFVKDGGAYQVSYDADLNLFTTASQGSNGIAPSFSSGKQGGMSVNLPLFSSRSYVHRAVFSLRGPEAVAVKDGVKLEIPLPMKVLGVWQKMGDSFFEMKEAGEGVWSNDKPVVYQNPSELHLHGQMFGAPQNQEQRSAEFHQKSPMLLTLLANLEDKFWDPFRVAPTIDRAVYLFAEIPPEFRPSGHFRENTHGRVVFALPLALEF